MKNRFHSIKVTYAIVMLFLVVTFTTAVSVLWGSLYKFQLWKGVADHANQMMESSNRNFDKMLSDINYRMFSLSFNSEFNRILMDTEPKSSSKMITDRRAMEGLLRYAASENSSIQNILVVATAGSMRESYSSGFYDTVTREEIAQYYKMAMEEENVIFITQPGSTRDKMKLIMAFILHRGNASEALMLITVNCNTLLKSYSIQNQFEYGLVLYNHATGEMILEENLAEIGMKGGQLNVLSLPLGEQEDGYEILRMEGGNYMLMRYRSLVTDWETFIMIPQLSLQGQYLNAAIVNIIMITLCAVLALIAAWWCAGLLTRDILKLCGEVEKVDGEHLDISTTVSTSNEIGLLGRKFEEMVERLKYQMQVKERDEGEKRKLEIKALQAQINPHFLYNSLSTIKFMAKLQNADSIMEATDALSNIMRINMSKDALMTMEQEKQYLESYICLQEYQKSYPIRFSCILEQGVAECKIIKLLIQPLVENSIQHGGILERNGLAITVRARILEEKLHITVYDNGKGIPKEKLVNMMRKLDWEESIGLFNTAERIRLHYGEAYGITLESQEGEYTQVEMILPIVKGESGHAEGTAG